MKSITLSIEGMTCGHCVASVRSALSAVPGVSLTKVGIGKATIDVPDAQSDELSGLATAAVTGAGYPAGLAGA